MLKKATVSGIVNSSSQLIVNVRANNVVGSCVSSNYGSYALVSLPIRTDADVYNFFVGQFKQIGTGYGLGGATDMEVTIDYWYY